MIRFLALSTTLLLGACSSEPITRFAVPPVPVTEKIRVGVRSVEVREVALPTYAGLEEIYVETPDGALTSDAALLWADDPTRAVTLSLARALGDLTGARVAAEPWPFEELAEVALTVRVDEMVAGRDGRFRLSGQYYVSSRDGSRTDRAESFALAAPYVLEAGAPGIAAARGAVVHQLATAIARRGL